MSKILSFFLWLPIDKSDDYEIIRGTLLLFVPFRNEHSEITSKGEASCRIIKIMKFQKKYNHTIIHVGKERLSTVLQKEYRVSYFQNIMRSAFCDFFNVTIATANRKILLLTFKMFNLFNSFMMHL